jgi:hypothetical protein
MSYGIRYRTGEQVQETGVYIFDGYLDGTNQPAPTNEERVIQLSAGEVFPPLRSCNKACWWQRKR